MKKILFLIFISSVFAIPSFGVNFGMYQPESEYGLVDGFKWNFFGREKGQPFVQLKSETEEEKARIEKEKDKPKQKMSDAEEVQMYRFMLEDTAVF